MSRLGQVQGWLADKQAALEAQTVMLEEKQLVRGLNYTAGSVAE